MPSSGSGTWPAGLRTKRHRRKSSGRGTDLFDPGSGLNRSIRPDPISPAGFLRVEDAHLAIIGSLSSERESTPMLLSEIGDIAWKHPLDFFGEHRSSLLPSTTTFRKRTPLPVLIPELRRLSGVLVHPALHHGPSEEAALLLNLGRAGVPMWGTVSERVQRALPKDLIQRVREASLNDVVDSDARERLSIRLRRASWAGAFPTPPLSVVVATNRPDFISHTLAQMNSLSYPNLEFVLVTHGFALDQNMLGDANIRVAEVPPAMPFGEALNVGFQLSTGELVSKMDDDDWYSSEHLSDLVCAMTYSGAPLAAKAAEFVYLAQLGITIRRMADGSETYGSRNVAGGTFLMSRALYQEAGGWRGLSRHVDQALLGDLERLGIVWYRTHGHGYVLHRRKAGHTWDASVAYFLDSSVSQSRGLDLEGSLIVGS